jgi:magnesium chelatase family protein
MNAPLAGPLLRKHFKPSQKAVADLDRLTAAGKLSMRGYDRCLRLAWTLADIDGKSSPDRTHIQRAVALRGAETQVAA